MTGQREGLLGDIFDKVKDIITPDDDNKPQPPPQPDRPSEKPPVIEPKCCGQNPKFVDTGEDLTDDGTKVHDAGCPNHPDNKAAEVVA